MYICNGRASEWWCWRWLLLQWKSEQMNKSSENFLDHLCDMLCATFANLTDIKLCVTIFFVCTFSSFCQLNASIRSAVFVSVKTANSFEKLSIQASRMHPLLNLFSIEFFARILQRANIFGKVLFVYQLVNQVSKV